MHIPENKNLVNCVPYVFPPTGVKIISSVTQGVEFEYEGKTSALSKEDFEKLLEEDRDLGKLRRLHKIKYKLFLF